MKLFTVDWFSNNNERWKKYFKKLRTVPIQALEIGSFEGKSAIWALDNILIHPDSYITCIDNFSLKRHGNRQFYSAVIRRHFKENTKDYAHKLTLIE
jgi:hypothetical protein